MSEESQFGFGPGLFVTFSSARESKKNNRCQRTRDYTIRAEALYDARSH